MEARGHGRVVADTGINREAAGVGLRQEEREKIRPVETTAGRQGRNERDCIDRRRTGSHVKEYVVERGIITDAESAANDRLVIPEKSLQNPRSPGKPHDWAEVVKVFRNVWNCVLAQQQGRIPKWIGTGLLCHGPVVQQINRLLEPFPTQPQVKSQVVLHLPIILKVK